MNALPCGTYAAYQRHVKRGEVPDAECREANREYKRQWRANNPARTAGQGKKNNAMSRALWRLAREFPTRYQQLYREEVRDA